MPIASAELKLYKSSVVTNESGNGGRLSANEIVSGVANNLFPNITEAQRTAGITLKRKSFRKIANDADTAASNGKFYIKDITPGGTRAVLYAGTQRDTQGDLTGSERKYGAGRLAADVSAGATTLVVDVEPDNGAANIFQAGDTLYLSDGSNDEYVTIDTGGVSWSVDQATITLAAGTLNSYLAATPTTVSSCLEAASVVTSFDNWVETSTSGTYDEAGSPPTLDNIGTIEETWTLTFTSATDFSVVGDTVGSVGTGSTAGDFAPVNADFSKPYFTLLAAGFAGTWAIGETIVFQTHPAAFPHWCDLIVPAGTASYSNDAVTIGCSVEIA